MFQRYRQVPTPISAANIQLFADTGKKINKKHKRPENLITFSDPIILYPIDYFIALKTAYMQLAIFVIP